MQCTKCKAMIRGRAHPSGQCIDCRGERKQVESRKANQKAKKK